MTREERVHHQNSAHARSTTTFSAGASLTIATDTTVTLTIRHPRTVPVRSAESRAKSLLSTLSETSSPPSHSSIHGLITSLFLIAAVLLPLLPIALHILHRNELITVLAHAPAAALSLLILRVLTLFPHKCYLAVTATHLVHRPRGLLTTIQTYPLTILRSFVNDGNAIVANTVSPRVCIKALDKQTASAGVQALNDALERRERVVPPGKLLDAPGEVVVTASTPLGEYELPREKLDINRVGDMLKIRSVAPKLPKLVLLFVGFFVTHAVASVLLLFVFEDVARRVDPITASMIGMLALAGLYVGVIVVVMGWYLIRCIPRKWTLVVVGYRKDVRSGMIDVGKCREVVLERDNKGFGVKVLSSTGNKFFDVGGLSEGEACNVVRALRTCFPSLFQGASV